MKKHFTWFICHLTCADYVFLILTPYLHHPPGLCTKLLWQCMCVIKLDCSWSKWQNVALLWQCIYMVWLHFTLHFCDGAFVSSSWPVHCIIATEHVQFIRPRAILLWQHMCAVQLDCELRCCDGACVQSSLWSTAFCSVWILIPPVWILPPVL
jgi:hypothetical protein